MVKIGKFIKEYRIKNHMTQEEFGKEVGVKKQTVSKWEHDVIQPSMKKYIEIVQLVGIYFNEDDALFFENRKVYNVGLNLLYQNVRDYNSFYVFLDSFLEAHKLIEGESTLLGFLYINKTYEEDIMGENFIAVKSMELIDDLILIETPEYSVSFGKEHISYVEIKGSFNNETYVFNCYTQKNKDEYFQLLIGFGNGEL